MIFLTQAVDIKRAPLREMPQSLLALRRANQATGTARDGFVRQPLDLRAAHRTLGRHDELAGVGWASLQYGTGHFGNHVAGTPHNHCVADANVLAPYFVFVM